MTSLLVVNIVNTLLLIPITIIYFKLDTPLAYLFVYASWITYTIIVNIRLLKADDPIERMKKLDKGHMFAEEIEEFEQALKSVEFYGNIFTKHQSNNAIQQTYELLSNYIKTNVDKAIKWLSHYNYATTPSSKYIERLATDSTYAVHKLEELNELVLRVEDSSYDTDISSVNDLLNSLKEMLSNE